MGGREFAAVTQRYGTELGAGFNTRNIQNLVDMGIFALPSFASTGGPFHQIEGRITGEVDNGMAMACLYLALMLDVELDLLGAGGDILVDKSTQLDPLVFKLLSQLNTGRRVLMSDNEASTIQGAWCLTRWTQSPPENFLNFSVIGDSELTGLDAYRKSWRSQLAQLGVSAVICCE